MRRDSVMKKKIERIAIVGYGRIAQRHIENMRKMFSHVGVMICRSSDANVEEKDRNYKVTRDFSEMLSFNPQIAFIASPAPFHVEQALALAENGTHLFIEKPLATSLDGIDALFSECKKRNLILMVGYNMAFSNALQTIKRMIGSGQIGKVLSVHAEVGQYLPQWRPEKDYRETVSAKAALGGGVLFELSHEIDYVNWLLGGVRKVSCLTQRSGVLDLDVEDCATLLLEGQDGTHATVSVNMVQKIPSRSCRIVGAEGIIEWNYIKKELFVQIDGQERVAVSIDEGDANAVYLRMLQHFFECIETGKTPLVDGNRALESLKIVLAAKKSAVQGVSVRP